MYVSKGKVDFQWGKLVQSAWFTKVLDKLDFTYQLSLWALVLCTLPEADWQYQYQGLPGKSWEEGWG